VSHALAIAPTAQAKVEGDVVLRTRLAEGERAAIDEVYRAHYDALRAFAHRFIGDPAIAEDIVHDVFLALPRAMRGFRGDSSLRTFLFAIALRRGYKHMRSASRRRAAMGRFAEEPDAPPVPAPDNALGRKQLAAVLYDALDRLPRDQRTAFVLCQIDQMSAADAAVIVDAPEATVRTRLFHARRKLRELLAEQEPS
jgi:RNA polymerase sigma-70 factor (ECF subfamily)